MVNIRGFKRNIIIIITVIIIQLDTPVSRLNRKEFQRG